MKRLLLALILISNLASAQQKSNNTLWHLIVADSVTAKGIAKVTIAINKRQYFSTNTNGVIDIDKSLINPQNLIRISCIGYKPVALIVGTNYKFPDTVKLLSSVTSLKEVKINSSSSMEIGITADKKSYRAHLPTHPNEALAQFIPNYKKNKGTILSVEYVLHDGLHGIENPFRVRLYTKNKSSVTLDRELTTDSIIVYNPEKKTHVNVDISRYNIQLPEDGVIVVFETLSSSYYDRDSVWYEGYQFVKTPGIDVNFQKGRWYKIDYDKNDRKDSFSMVGPDADRWNWNGAEDQWFVYDKGIDFAFTITVAPDK